jgi:hypothetical protein
VADIFECNAVYISCDFELPIDVSLPVTYRSIKVRNFFHMMGDFVSRRLNVGMDASQSEQVFAAESQ